jgi:hypothetical protein
VWLYLVVNIVPVAAPIVVVIVVVAAAVVEVIVGWTMGSFHIQHITKGSCTTTHPVIHHCWIVRHRELMYKDSTHT